jgi:hypothetical protein
MILIKKINSIFALLVIVMMVLVTPACAMGPMTSKVDRETDDAALKSSGFGEFSTENSERTTNQKLIIESTKAVKTTAKGSYITDLSFNLAAVKNDSKAVYNFTAEELNKTRTNIANTTKHQKDLKALLITKTKEKNQAKAELDIQQETHIKPNKK